jgi:hypothetical protein
LEVSVKKENEYSEESSEEERSEEETSKEERFEEEDSNEENEGNILENDSNNELVNVVPLEGDEQSDNSKDISDIQMQ